MLVAWRAWREDCQQLDVVLDGKTFRMNLEVVVDAASDAAVGISVRDEEDSAAVVEAFDHGEQTTGEPPLARLLDNRPSNHTPEVDAALDDTMRIRATPDRRKTKRTSKELSACSPRRCRPAPLRDYLRASLPDYMVPGVFVALERLLLTPTGKVDRRALPAPEARPPRRPRPAPRPAARATRGEQLVGDLDLGGHSLLIMQAIAKLEARTGKRISRARSSSRPSSRSRASTTRTPPSPEAAAAGEPAAGLAPVALALRVDPRLEVVIQGKVGRHRRASPALPEPPAVSAAWVRAPRSRDHSRVRAARRVWAELRSAEAAAVVPLQSEVLDSLGCHECPMLIASRRLPTTTRTPCRASGRH